MHRLAVGVLCVAMGCRPGEARPVLEPASGSLSGYYPVTAVLDGTDVLASEVAEVWLGDVRAYDVVIQGDDQLTFMVQGAPRAGAQALELVGVEGGRDRFDDAFTYDPPADPVFDRLVAMGASFTQGVQGGVPVARGVVHSPPHFVARQSGAYLPLPMLVDPLFPTIGWDAIGPAPGCEVPGVVSFVASAALEVLPRLEDEELDTISFAKARVDPDLEIRNVGVGDTDLHALVHGPPDDPAELFVVKMVYAPYADIIEKIATSQLDLIEALDPSVVMIADTYGNDLIASIVLGTELDPGRITDEATFRADLDELTARLVATGAESFLANIPRPTLLPATADKRFEAMDAARADAEDRGEDGDAAAEAAGAEIDVLIAEIDATGARFNAILDEIAAAHPTIHVVDFAGMAEQVEAQPVVVGDQTVSIGKFGGILSTDGVHFGDVGYGLLANEFIATMNRELGTDLAPVDLVAEIEDDPYSPSAGLAAGVDASQCR